MNYEATIKNKVKIKASFGITEYLAVSMQGYSEYKFKLFGKSKLEFDYAMNLYTQTDIDMQVLVCSTNKANEEYTDISKEIKDMLSSDEENDTGNLVKQMQDMVENDSGEITLLDPGGYADRHVRQYFGWKPGLLHKRSDRRKSL